MTSDVLDVKELSRKVIRFGLVAFLAVGAIFFIPAGTFDYWQAWAYLGILSVPMVLVFRYLLHNSPQLLERRMRLREREKTQKRVVSIAMVFLVGAFVLPGLDRRWGWSALPLWAVVAAEVFTLLGYGLVVRVLMENRFASRTVEVEQDQNVISSGPYAIVRHPMYLGVSVFYLASPLALGSWWGFFSALFILPVLVARIVNEEQVLERDLAGYREYKAKIKFRLLPGIW
jgi:protein-S-isoprenylcysteine O-methyltransferase Ste14